MTELNFNGKTVIVTGANKGIGFAIANFFFENNAEVVFAIRNPQKAKLPKEILESERVLVLKLDVRKNTLIEKMVDKTIKKFGKIDILVNNAGVDEPCDLLNLTKKHLSFIMDTNFKGTVFCSKIVAKGMVNRKYGKIINISSIAGKEGTPMHSAYVSSKHAVIGFTKSISKELIKYNINVNAVCPGLINTDMLINYFKEYSKLVNSKPSKELKKMINLTPRGKMGVPSDVAELVGFLASDVSKNIVGQAINTCGGIY